MKTIVFLLLSAITASAATAKLVPLSEIKLPTGVTIEQVKKFRKEHPVAKPVAPPKAGKISQSRITAATSREYTKAFLDKLNVFTNRLAKTLVAAGKFAPSAVEDGPKLRNPFMFPASDGFPATFFCSVDQPASMELIVEYQYAIGGAWNEALRASCWNTNQSWIVSLYGESAQLIVRARYVPCTPDPPSAVLSTQMFAVSSQPLGGRIGLQHKSELTGKIRDTDWFRSVPD